MTKKKTELNPLPKEYTYLSCKCDFTSDELNEKTETLARKLEDKENKEDAKKEIASQYKAEIDALSNEIKLLATHLRNKYEFRSVKCEVKRDFEKGIVKIYRTDTAELIKERAMTGTERQAELDLESITPGEEE